MTRCFEEKHERARSASCRMMRAHAAATLVALLLVSPFAASVGPIVAGDDVGTGADAPSGPAGAIPFASDVVHRG